MPTLIGPFSQIITLSGISLKGPVKQDQLEILENGGIVTENEKIVETGSFEKLAKKYEQITEIPDDQVAIPGLIDCHTHLIWGGSRAHDFERRNSGMSYQDILARGGGIFDSVHRTREASTEQLEQDLMERSNQHLRSGVTTIEVKTGYGLSKESEINLLQSINKINGHVDADLVPTFLGAHVCPDDFEKADYLRYLAGEVFPLIKQDKLTNRIDIFLEEEAFPVRIAVDYLQSAIKNGFDITCHAGQFSPEGVEVAVAHQAKSADHLESIGENEILMLANSDTVAVALPGASLGLGMEFSPARKLLDAGCTLAIATDWNPGSAPMGDLITQASILATYEKLTSAEILSGLTFRAAHALGLNDRGRLVKGHLADIVSFPVDHYLEIAYVQGRLNPAYIWKKGNLI